MDGWVDGCLNGWMNGWMDGWTDAWMDGWTDDIHINPKTTSNKRYTIPNVISSPMKLWANIRPGGI